MKNNYLHLCDKNYDSEFDNINLLLRYPWVGCNFASSNCRPLVLGDSHYATNGKDFSQKEYDNFKNNKASTRDIINTVIKNYCNGESTWPMFRNMLTTFINVSIDNVIEFWSKVAFYNFIQEPMKSSDEKPSQEDIANGWRCLADVIEILRPTSILIFGVRNDKCSNMINENNNRVRLEDFKDDTMVNGCRPRIGKIILGNEEIPITLIKHTSQRYSCDSWRKYLLERDTRMMNHLLS